MHSPSMPFSYKEDVTENRKSTHKHVPAQHDSKLHIVLYEDSIRDVSWQSLITTDEMETSEVVCDGRLALPSVLTCDVSFNLGKEVIY